ncbi:hypothetical protein N9L68_07735 [bacterium]|nr:hypothetical protein [bacterium]
MLLDVRPGYMLMCKREQGSSGVPGGNWHGPLRVLGMDDNVIWGLHEGAPVAVAANHIRSANAFETLAHTILSRGNLVEKKRQADPRTQHIGLDFRRDPPPSQGGPREKRARITNEVPELPSDRRISISSSMLESTTGGPVVFEPASSSQTLLMRRIAGANERWTTR